MNDLAQLERYPSPCSVRRVHKNVHKFSQYMCHMGNLFAGREQR